MLHTSHQLTAQYDTKIVLLVDIERNLKPQLHEGQSLLLPTDLRVPRTNLQQHAQLHGKQQFSFLRVKLIYFFSLNHQLLCPLPPENHAYQQRFYYDVQQLKPLHYKRWQFQHLQNLEFEQTTPSGQYQPLISVVLNVL